MGGCDKIVTMTLRLAQLICAVAAIGIASHYIADNKEKPTDHLSRFIFTDGVAGLSAFFAFIWLIPFSSNYMNWYIDGMLCLFNAVASAWLIYCTEDKCGKEKSFDLNEVAEFHEESASLCDKWRALYVFTIISTAIWLLSAGIGFFWKKKHMDTEKVKIGKVQVRPGKAKRRR